MGLKVAVIFSATLLSGCQNPSRIAYESLSNEALCMKIEELVCSNQGQPLQALIELSERGRPTKPTASLTLDERQKTVEALDALTDCAFVWDNLEFGTVGDSKSVNYMKIKVGSKLQEYCPY